MLKEERVTNNTIIPPGLMRVAAIANINLIGCDDEILRIEYEEEVHKLGKLLNAYSRHPGGRG